MAENSPTWDTNTLFKQCLVLCRALSVGWAIEPPLLLLWSRMAPLLQALRLTPTGPASASSGAAHVGASTLQSALSPRGHSGNVSPLAMVAEDPAGEGPWKLAVLIWHGM